MRIKINREQPFQVLATNFSIGPSSSGYDLQISADGVNFTTLFSVGANVTRMVTGVANGSTYRLAGNTDEDVIVNWFRQCDDGGSGGGSGAQGPEGPQGPAGPQGATGAQGPQGEAAQGGGDAHTLLAVSNLNDSSLDAAEAGDVRAKYIQNSEIVSTGGTVDSEGETFPSDGSLAVKYVGELDSIDGLRWKNGPDVFEMNVSGDGLAVTLISGDGSRTASEVTATTTGTISGEDFLMEYKDGGDNTVISFDFYGKYWECHSYGDSMQDYIFVYAPGEAQWLGEALNTYKTAEGVWQYAEGPHTIGKFSEFGLGITTVHKVGFNYYGDFSESVRIMDFDYSYGGYPHFISINTNGQIEIYDSNSKDLVHTIEKGEFYDLGLGASTSSRFVKIYNDLDNRYIGIDKSGVQTKITAANTTSTGSGWVIVNQDEPQPWANGSGGIDYTPKRLVSINHKGQIIETIATGLKTMYINTTATTSSAKLELVTNTRTNGPDRIFVPTTGGNQGQVLTSTGDNSAPSWATLIKSVKITSDAYEALAVKDPNTLYLIVDDE